MDAPVKMQGAVFVMSEAVALDYHPTIIKCDTETIMRPFYADATIYTASMSAGFSLRAKRGKPRTGPSPTNETIGELDQGHLGAEWEVGSDIVPFPNDADPTSASALHAHTPPAHLSPGAAGRSMDEEKMYEDRVGMIKTGATPPGAGSDHGHRSTPRTESRGVLNPFRLASTVFKGASAPPKGSMNPGDSQVITNTYYSNEKLRLRRLISNLSDPLGVVGCDFLADAGELDGEKGMGTGAPIDSGIGVFKADMVDDLGAVAESGIEDNCREFYEQSFEDVKLDIHEGSPDRQRFARYTRYYASPTGDERCLFADCAFWRNADICDATKYEFKPAAAQCPALIAAVGEAGEKCCRFGNDGADDCYELETAVPLEDKVTGLDQALDG